MTPVTTVITVAAAGTPVRWTTDTTIGCAGIVLQAWKGNAGDVYLGNAATIDRVLGTSLITLLRPRDVYNDQTMNQTNALRPSDYWFDADANGAIILATYWSA